MTTSVDGKLDMVRVFCLRDSKGSPKAISSCLQGGGMNEDDATVDPVFAADHRRQRNYNSVVATGGVVVEVEECAASKIGEVVLEFF